MGHKKPMQPLTPRKLHPTEPPLGLGPKGQPTKAAAQGATMAGDAARLSPPQAAEAARWAAHVGSSDPAARVAWARRTLGLEGKALPDPAQREANFQRFAERFFPKRPADSDEFDANTYGPEPGTPLHALFERYARTDYGAAMILKVLHEAGDRPFQIKAVHGISPKAWDDHMFFPPDFPKPGATFRFGGQPVDPLAILHHEFEHTRFGQHAQGEHKLLDEELHTVRMVENPVRVLNGFEPRHTYTQVNEAGEAVLTISTLPPFRQAPGAWTFDPLRPDRLVPVP